MPVRKANAEWRGDLKRGSGNISTESGVLKNAAYSFASRFEKAAQTNPEELIGAAHAACYSMALSNMLSGAGFTVNSVKTEDKVHIEKVESGFSITKIKSEWGESSWMFLRLVSSSSMNTILAIPRCYGSKS